MNYWSMLRGSFCMDLCSLESVQALSQPCHLSSCHSQVCFFQSSITALRLSHQTLLHQAKRNIQFFWFSITCRAESTIPARVKHKLNLPKHLPAFQALSLLLTQRLEPAATKMQTLSQPRMQQLPLLRAILGSLQSHGKWGLSTELHPLLTSGCFTGPGQGTAGILASWALVGCSQTHSSYGRNRFLKINK